MQAAIQRRAEAARRIVRSQAGRMHRNFGRARATLKADGTRVTAADLAISAAILRRLRTEFPADQAFSEEGPGAGPAPAVTARFCWVLDPIDGTNNFSDGIPFCAISLALLEHGRPVYGVVYDLGRRTLIHGGPGIGAFDGGRPARARPEPPHDHSLVAVHSPYERDCVPQVAAVVRAFKMRGLGSSTLHLAYVGIGLLDGLLDHNVRFWDIAAAHAIALGGGAEIHYLRNHPFPLRRLDPNPPRIHYIAGNAAMCRRLRQVLKACRL
ncbi:MAG TPA: inositol monophosphatase [Opitutaceae bacterium]|nr:inositol monophosphatase [Opitutaceae bacterium]